MRFILVQIKHPLWDFNIPQWRATCVTAEKTIDVFFFAATDAAARDHVRARYPNATFTDQEQRQCPATQD